MENRNSNKESQYISDGAIDIPLLIKTETLHAPICDTNVVLFTKASAVLKMHIVISKENRVVITYEIYDRIRDYKKVITCFEDAKNHFDSL